MYDTMLIPLSLRVRHTFIYLHTFYITLNNLIIYLFKARLQLFQINNRLINVEPHVVTNFVYM